MFRMPGTPLPRIWVTPVAPGVATAQAPNRGACADGSCCAERRCLAGARFVRAPTRGKDRIARLVPVDYDWRLMLPAERIEVPGEPLAQSLVPDIEAAPSAGP